MSRLYGDLLALEKRHDAQALELGQLRGFVAKLLADADVWDVAGGQFRSWDDDGNLMQSFPITVGEAGALLKLGESTARQEADGALAVLHGALDAWSAYPEPDRLAAIQRRATRQAVGL